MYNTGNAVPSAALEDMADNAQTFDALVTKTEGTTTDRLGRTRRVFQQILMDMGFQPLAGSFQTGATITARNQTLYDEVSHAFYAWGGTIPVGGYVVQAGSAPSTAGGVGVGLWTDKTDLMLRSELFGSLGYISEYYTISTLFADLQTAMQCASDNSVMLIVPDGEYTTSPITIPSNLIVHFHPSCVINAASGYTTYQTLFDFSGADNVVFNTNGCSFAMPKSEYTTGEWRHCFNLESASNIRILGAPNISGAGGDGIYINALSDSYIDSPVVTNSRRNNISVISCENVTIYEPTCNGAVGTAPQCGIDIEPNAPTEKLKGLKIIRPTSINNAGYGISIYLDSFKTGSPDDVDILIESPKTKNNGGIGINVKNVFNPTDSYKGVINISDPYSYSDGFNGIQVYDKGISGPELVITNPTIINPCQASQVYPNYSAISVIDTSTAPTGGIYIDAAIVKSNDGKMSYAALLEYGQGIVDTDISVKSTTGHTVSPVRHGGLSTSNTVALASSVNIVCDNTKQEEAKTASANLADPRYYSLTLTNEGASAQVTLNASQIPPKNVPYRFRCKTAVSFRVGTTNALDRIIGTSAQGMTVSTTTIGAEAELRYFGSIGGINYWQFIPIGAASAWTFN